MTDSVAQRPLRLWPGVVLAGLLVLIRFVVPVIAPKGQVLGQDVALLAVLGGMVGALAVLVWWLFFSRAPWAERIGAIALMVVATIAVRPLTDISIQNGMMGMMFAIYAVPPTLALALLGYAAVSRRLSEGPRRAAMAIAMLVGCCVWLPIRTNGLLGGAPDLEWRWTPTAEEVLLARAGAEPDPIPPSVPVVDVPKEIAAMPSAAASAAPAASAPIAAASGASPAVTVTSGASMTGPAVEWPGFRGPDRDSVVHHVRINTDWSATPPVQIWRRAVGPGWSSFAVSGDWIYTQEQRGEDEIVACYRLSTGEPVWRHRDPVRFWESNGGAGPRATPTLHNGRVYSHGATGVLNALDGVTGALIWSRNVSTDSGTPVSEWGFSSSPLVIDDVVIVAAAGTMAGYDVATGKQRWTGPKHGGGYSSPHRVRIDGVVQALLLGGPSAISVAPADGTVLWQHQSTPGTIVQPALLPDGDVVINSLSPTGGGGTQRLHVTRKPGGWNVEERWTSNGLKPYFNDFVIHKGHAYGFDGNILSSVNLENGERAWKGGRYGNGQMLLLAEQDLLLVISEEGELALVSATPAKFTEIARFPALNAKTWNHPVMVGDVLLVRNGEEMAAFRLSLQKGATE